MSIQEGKDFVDKFIKNYGDMTIDEFVSEEEKTKTALFRYLIDHSDTSIDKLAAYLDCKPQSLRNKMSRDSFSIDDLIIAAYACNYTVVLKNNSTKEEKEIDIVDFFKPLHDDVLVRISELEHKDNIEEKRKEYEILKQKIQALQNEYGFN